MLPSDSNQQEQYAPVTVDLSCDFPGAEVILIDGQQRLVMRAMQRVQTTVPPGVYTVRVSIGESLRDQSIIVRPDQAFVLTLAPPPVASAIPLEGSARSHEYHQAAVRNVGAQPMLHPDADASIFVLLREWTAEGVGQRSTGPLASELLLWSADGGDLFTFNTDVADASATDRATAQGVQVRAGFYRLVSRCGSALIEMAVHAVKGWQTQIYLLSQAAVGGLAPDFGRASVVWARPGMGFDPNREDLRVLESVRSAAESGRQLLTDKGLTDALYQKFDNPMLGLISAHALRQRNKIDRGLLATVTANLEGMLGPIPDVLSLKLALDPNAAIPPVEYPPMLRWSWELLLQRSVERPDVIRRYSLAEQVGGFVIDRGVWLSWVGDPQKARFNPGAAANTANEAAITAVRQTWQQMSTVKAITPRITKRRAIAPEAFQSLDFNALSRPSVKSVVQMYRVPRAVVEEAVGTVMFTPPPAAAEQPTGDFEMNQARRKQFNERFFQRLLSRRPNDRTHFETAVREEQKKHEQRRAVPEAAMAELPVDPAGQIRRDPRDMALETIVSRERPVLFVQDGVFNTTDVTALGPEAIDLVNRMKQQGSKLLPMLPLIGRIDVVNFPNNIDFLGTAWFVDTDIVVTNRHVASLIAQWDGRKFAFTRGIGGRMLDPVVCNAHEFDDLAPDASRIFKVKEVLYIEPASGPDIAFLRVDRKTDGRAPGFIQVAPTDAASEVPVCVVGYPARASRRVIPDQDLMKDLYRDRFDVKRAAPGFTSGIEQGSTTHDCTTLGGNSGSVVLDLATGVAVGLHYAGIYEEDNFAVRASVLSDYIKRKRWNTPPIIETRAPAPAPAPVVAPTPSSPAAPAPAGASVVVGAAGGVAASVSITLPVTVTVTIGMPVTSSSGAVAPGISVGATRSAAVSPAAPSHPVVAPPVVPVEKVEEVLSDYWASKPANVLGARVGYFDEGDSIGNTPCIAVSVKPSGLATFELGAPVLFKGVPVRYLPADVDEQIQSLPAFESVDSISYDDDARTADRFSFAPVEEPMEVIMHVGPEYSWDVLKKFIDGSTGRLVSAMYEFHATHIKDALEARLRAGGNLQLVLDNATFAGDEDFDRAAVFERWADEFQFTRIVAPEGLRGLISDSYHIKVTVRDDDTFWLSSGNWKGGSSQPVITQQQRDNATTDDLPGNREWHVVIKNKKLATRFRSHILQDLKRSQDLGGRELPKRLLDETLVDIPIEMPQLELEVRKPPSKIIEPKTIAFSTSRKLKVKPLLTPDREGAVFSEAVLELINSATKSLLFQIPYIGMPSSPNQDRGFIDDLIKALTEKLKTLDDARVILRSGGKNFSAPAHAAWFFKSKGVDIDAQLKVIDNHHTKGMIVDGKRVLLGSHNWSKPGVTLNRDASLIFDDEEIAGYYTDAFEIDWNRANRLKPKKFVKPESVILEAVGDAPPPGFRRVPLSELLTDD